MPAKINALKVHMFYMVTWYHNWSYADKVWFLTDTQLFDHHTQFYREAI